MTLAVVPKARMDQMIAASPTLKNNPGWGKSCNRIVRFYQTAINKKYLDPKVTLEAYTVSLRGRVKEAKDFTPFLDRLSLAFRTGTLAKVQALAPIHQGIPKPAPVVAPKPASAVVAPKPVAPAPVSAATLAAENKALEAKIRELSTKIDNQNKDIDAAQAEVRRLGEKVQVVQGNNTRLEGLLRGLT